MDAEPPSDQHGLTITTYRVDPLTGAATPPQTVHLPPADGPVRGPFPPCECPRSPGCQERERQQAAERRGYR